MNISIIIFFVLLIIGIIIWSIVHTARKHKKYQAKSNSNNSIIETRTTSTVPKEPDVIKIIRIKNQDGSLAYYKAKRKNQYLRGNHNDYIFYDEFDNRIFTLMYLNLLYDFIESDSYLNGNTFDLENFETVSSENLIELNNEQIESNFTEETNFAEEPSYVTPTFDSQTYEATYTNDSIDTSDNYGNSNSDCGSSSSDYGSSSDYSSGSSSFD